TLISALALLGLVVTLARREFLLIVLLFVPAIIDPRSAASISLIPWAMLAAVGFVEIVIPGLYALNHKLQETQDIESNWHVYFMNSSAIKIALTALIFYAFFGAALSDQAYPKLSLTPSDRSAMAWVANHIPPQSRFVILTGETEAFSDSVSEWFPVLGKSISLATIQGHEWMPGKLFQTKLNEYYALQACMTKTYTCVEEWGSETEQDFDYVLVSQNGLADSGNFLATSLTESGTYKRLYQEGDVAIFKKIP
ncbi:MAG: hypothetical protein Q7T89_05590, partial [Anaerolineales bacterium]|nr:hypothetical protein [Anaerolineales bacterium]